MSDKRLRNWKAFCKYVRKSEEERKANKWRGVYWRGQSDPSWKLASQFERIIVVDNEGWEKSQGHSPKESYKKHVQPHQKTGFYRKRRQKYLRDFQWAATRLR